MHSKLLMNVVETKVAPTTCCHRPETWQICFAKFLDPLAFSGLQISDFRFQWPSDLFHKVFGPLGLQWPCHATWGYSSFNPVQNANNFLWRWLKLMLHASPALRCNYFEPVRYMSRYFGCFGLQSFHFPADSTWHTTQFTVHRPGGIQYVFGVIVLHSFCPFWHFL